MAMVDDETLIRRALDEAEREGREQGSSAGQSRGVALAIAELLAPLIASRGREFDLVRHLSDLRIDPLLEIVRRAGTGAPLEFVLGAHLPPDLADDGAAPITDEQPHQSERAS